MSRECSKRLMILGAGVMQVPLIKQAKAMGIHTVVAGLLGDYPGLSLADTVCDVDLADPPSVLEAARTERIHGVVTCGIDLPVPAIGLVSETLGLPGFGVQSAWVLSDKMRMKECFVAHGVRTAHHLVCRNVSDALTAFSVFQNPIMLKAVDQQGSVGIVKVNRGDELNAAVQYVLEATGRDYFIAEEYLQGDEFGAQAFVQDGLMKFLLPHGDLVYHGKSGIPIGHYVPYATSREVAADLAEQVEKCIQSTGIHTAALNLDLMLCGGRVYVLEVGARCGATMLGETVSLFYGFNYYEQIINAALGAAADCRPRSEGIANASMTLYSEEDGTLAQVENRNPPNENVVQVQIDKPIGSHVQKFRSGIDRIGHVIVKGSSADDALNLLHETVARICICVS